MSKDMSGINRDILTHELKIYPSIRSIAQNWCTRGKEMTVAVKQQVWKLIDANFVREIWLQTWVENPIIVKKNHLK